MLQIAYGKFFKTENRYRYNAKAILFSNFILIDSLKTVLGDLETSSIHNFDGINDLIYSYINQMEKNGDQVRLGEVLRIGDKEIVDSFRCLCVVGLNAYLSLDKDQVAKLCVNRKIENPILKKRINLTVENINSFKNIAEKFVSLSRRDFEIIDRCFKQFTHAVEVIDENIDLAYSMFAYCLESLSQEYGEESRDWEDYDPNLKSNLDEIFNEISESASNSIKTILLGKGHNKVKRRFVSFIKSTIDESFYTNDLPEMGLAASDLDHVLNNLYSTRSGFVHELAPIQEQIRHNLWRGDFLSWDNKIYLTINGVVRLTRHIILQTIENRPSIDKEEFNWRSALPGIVKIKMSTEYWVADEETFNEHKSHDRLSGFLQSLDESVFSSKPILDIRPLLNKIEIVFDRSSTEQKRSMLAIYGLAILYAEKALDIGSKMSFLEKNLFLFDKCSLQSMLFSLFSSKDYEWTTDEFKNNLKLYSTEKYKKNSVVLPRRFHLALLLSLANRFHEEGNLVEFEKIVLKSRFEVSGNEILQKKLLVASSSKEIINIYDILKDDNRS